MSSTIRQRFASAPYAFFRVHNYDEAFRRFIDGTDEQPHFTYAEKFTFEALESRREQLEKVKADAFDEDDETMSEFAARRLLETELLADFLHLRHKPADKQAYEDYRISIAALYGQPDPAALAGIVEYLRQRAERTGTQEVFRSLRALLPAVPDGGHLYRPERETFLYYRDLLRDSAHPAAAVWAVRPERLGRAVAIGYINSALESSGAVAAGWKVSEGRAGNNVMVSQHRQRVVVGRHYAPQSGLRLRQIIAHEVHVHVRRVLLHTDNRNMQTEEGTAVMVEQLFAHKFMYRRLTRYLAAALAWGADGRPRTFRETFDVLWRAFMIIGRHDGMEAKRRAFSECTRIFRGGLPAVAGAAFTKDMVYLQTNLSVWKYLEENKLSQQEFLDLIDGRKDMEDIGF
jgi:hypothetical protein